MHLRRLLLTCAMTVLVFGALTLATDNVQVADRPTGTDTPLVRRPSSETAGARTPCPDGDLATPAEMTPYRAADGGCLPLGQIATYRCAPEASPTLLSAGREFSGAAATPAGLSRNQVVMGTNTAGTSIAFDATDAAAAFVIDAEGTVQRWPEVPAWPTPSGGVVRSFPRPHVFVVGDSVLLGAAEAIRGAFADWGAVVDAAVNRSTGAGREVVRARRGEVQDVVVIALGYNDGAAPEQWAAQANGLLDDLHDVDLVVWLTLREARDYYVVDNQILREMDAARANLVLADWNAVAPPEGLGTDGLHLNPTGAAAMTGLVNHVVRTTVPALGRGDQSCRPAVDAALAAVP